MILLLAVAVWLCGGLLCLMRGIGRRVGPASAVLGCIIGLLAVPAAFSARPPAIDLPWAMPYGALHLLMDPLSAVFAVPILIVCALGAVYGSGYLAHSDRPARAGRSWLFYNILAASMFVVVLAQNALLFLIAWELMSLASFFLVMHDHEQPAVRHAGLTYLVAMHLGAFCLLVFFLLLGRAAGSLDFAAMRHAVPSAPLGAALFVLAVLGFGTKAGIVPMHVWLPEAHPAAPSHVSAVMSGVMIKTGVYGLLRAATFLGAPQAWWGWTLIAVGAASGVMGILFALAQHDVKRMLAYCSVENVGIICLGLGLGWLGSAHGHPLLAVLGFSGALLHVFNHAMFKSLLFLGAGSVAHAAGTRELDHLGGLLRRMPRTGMGFLVGAIAICGLPPFNGFVGEFLIYMGAFQAILAPDVGTAATALFAAGSLALIGGLAVACFAKAFGIVFLGAPRGAPAAAAREAGPAMTVPMLALAALCLLVGLAGPFAFALLQPAVALVAGAAALPADRLAAVSGWLWRVTLASGALILLAAVVAAARRRTLAEREVGSTVTWDCGYAAPSPRMQYTSSSFAQPITNLFRASLGTRFAAPRIEGLFPANTDFSTETPDIWRRRVYEPAFRAVSGALGRFRWFQHGRINLYVLCIVVALIALLAWKLR